MRLRLSLRNSRTLGAATLELGAKFRRLVDHDSTLRSGLRRRLRLRRSRHGTLELASLGRRRRRSRLGCRRLNLGGRRRRSRLGGCNGPSIPCIRRRRNARRLLRHGGRLSCSRCCSRALRQCALEYFDARSERFKRKVALRAHHAREANLKRQARIGRRAQFRIQIAQHAQDIREAIDSKHLSLARHARQRALRRVHGNRPIGERQHIQIAHVRGQVAHESSQVGTRFHIFGNPGEARRRIARGNRSNNAAHVVDVE